MRTERVHSPVAESIRTLLVHYSPAIHRWFDLEALRPLLLDLFGFQNALIENLEIGEDVNERASNDFIEAVQAFLS